MCPDPELLSVHFDGELPEPWKTRLEEHLVSCPLCGEKLELWRRVRAARDAVPVPALDAARERVWARLAGSLSGVSRRELFPRSAAFSRVPVWRRQVSLPFPAVAAAALAVAVLVLALFRAGPGGGAQNAVMAGAGQNGSAAPAGFILESEEIVPAADMNGVLQYLGSETGTDFVIIRLPENRRFTSAGQAASLKAADYPARNPR